MTYRHFQFRFGKAITEFRIWLHVHQFFKSNGQSINKQTENVSQQFTWKFDPIGSANRLWLKYTAPR